MIESMLTQASSVGRDLPPEVRPYFLVSLAQFGTVSPTFLPDLAAALEVKEVPPLCHLVPTWLAACHSDKTDVCAAIESQWDAAGVSEQIQQALDSADRLSDSFKSLVEEQKASQ